MRAIISTLLELLCQLYNVLDQFPKEAFLRLSRTYKANAVLLCIHGWVDRFLSSQVPFQKDETDGITCLA